MRLCMESVLLDWDRLPSPSKGWMNRNMMPRETDEVEGNDLHLLPYGGKMPPCSVLAPETSILLENASLLCFGTRNLHSAT